MQGEFQYRQQIFYCRLLAILDNVAFSIVFNGVIRFLTNESNLLFTPIICNEQAIKLAVIQFVCEFLLQLFSFRNC